MNRIQASITAVASVALLPAMAKTVAYWPMNVTERDSVKLIRCAISPVNDLTIDPASRADKNVNSMPGWNLPPNPDPTEKFAGDQVTRMSVYNGYHANRTLYSTDSRFLQNLGPDRDFTLEGYVNERYLPWEHPSDIYRSYLASFTGQDGYGSWELFFVCPHASEEIAVYFRLYGEGVEGWAHEICRIPQNGATGAWFHYALTFEHDVGGGKARVGFYRNGTSLGQIELPNAKNYSAASEFSLFGISGPREFSFNGWISAWRMSDCALAPTDFLCAGESGTVVPEPAPKHTDTTVAYWKLDRAADGTIDGRDSVGNADLSQGRMQWDGVFADSVVKPCRTSHDGNGSAKYDPQPYAMLRANGLATEHLRLSDAFTVEGWMYPQWRSAAVPDAQVLFTTIDTADADQRGWCVRLLREGANYHLALTSQDGIGTCLSGTANARISADHAISDGTWHQVKVSYDPAGNGTWTCWFDGVQEGTLTHVAAGDLATTPAKADGKFQLGGFSSGNVNFCGLLDDWKVLDGLGTAVATWALDSADGVSFDAHDSTGSYHFVPARDPLNVSAVTDAPTVTNPDRSASFDGDPTANSGSVQICLPVDNMANKPERDYLAARSGTLTSALRDLSTGWTLEGWIYPQQDVDGGCDLIFSLGEDTNNKNHENFVFERAQDGTLRVREIYDGMFSKGWTKSFTFDATKGAAPLNTWTHFALEAYESDGNFVLELFVNGVSAGQASAELDTSFRPPLNVYIGGNPIWKDRGFIGKLDSFRISRGRLKSTEFLCAANATPAPSEGTLAYWPLDNASGAAVTAAATLPEGYLFYQGMATGSDERARVNLPKRIDDLPRGNVGSIAVSGANSLKADYLGEKLGLSGAWSVEGWYRSTSATALVCGTAATAADAGWCLSFDAMEANPVLKLAASGGAAYSPFVNASFAAPKFDVNGWNHILLTYDTGVWSLFVNGESVGSAASVWSVASLVEDQRGFALGQGCFDMWRAATGVLTVEESFFYEKPGLVITVR